MVGDHSFKIKPRLGDYVLLNRNQVSRWCWMSAVEISCKLS